MIKKWLTDMIKKCLIEFNFGAQKEAIIKKNKA